MREFVEMMLLALGFGLVMTWLFPTPKGLYDHSKKKNHLK